MTLADLVHPQDREAALLSAHKALQHAAPQSISCSWQNGSGDAAPVEMRTVCLDSDGEPLLLLILKNLSERQRLEAELRQSQKMEAIGKLAGGIAHDFNNVLTTILSLTEAMMQGHTPPNAESLREIHQAARHAAELTHHLLAFSRRQILQMRNVQLDAVVDNHGEDGLARHRRRHPPGDRLPPAAPAHSRRPAADRAGAARTCA